MKRLNSASACDYSLVGRSGTVGRANIRKARSAYALVKMNDSHPKRGINVLNALK